MQRLRQEEGLMAASGNRNEMGRRNEDGYRMGKVNRKVSGGPPWGGAVQCSQLSTALAWQPQNWQHPSMNCLNKQKFTQKWLSEPDLEEARCYLLLAPRVPRVRLDSIFRFIIFVKPCYLEGWLFIRRTFSQYTMLGLQRDLWTSKSHSFMYTLSVRRFEAVVLMAH